MHQNRVGGIERSSFVVLNLFGLPGKVNNNLWLYQTIIGVSEAQIDIRGRIPLGVDALVSPIPQLLWSTNSVFVACFYKNGIIFLS